MEKEDITFLRQILEIEEFTHACSRHGHRKPTLYEPGGGVRNPGLKIEKNSWSLCTKGDQVERVGVHYESVRPGHFAIHVEIEPYEKGKSIKENDIRLTTLAYQL